MCNREGPRPAGNSLSGLAHRVNIVRFAAITPTPWKNGLGTTTQLAIHPPGATTEDFEWRVSIARLDASAPFSAFAGIERCLAVLQGEMTLVRSQGSHILTPASHPVCFDGSEAVEGRVGRGPVLDLNVMYKVSQWRATMRRLRLTADTTLSANGWSMLCSLSDTIDVETDGKSLQLGWFDVLEWRQTSVRLAVSRPVDAYLIEFQRQPLDAGGTGE